jgi:hypothetical protein
MKSFAALALVIASFSLLGCTKFATPTPPPDASADTGHDSTPAGSDAPADLADAAPDAAPASDAADAPIAPPSDAADAPIDIADIADTADAANADTAAALPLGHACSANADCASGHCATGVCCDQACTGPCAQCSLAGACQMPADDSACGTITCPADTACRDFDSSIQGNRCKSLGQCKASGDCLFTDKPKGTFCGYYDVTFLEAQFCDGSGTCAGPTVLCGSSGECPVNPGVCCSGTTCTVDETCSSSFRVRCDEAADCAAGQVCCLLIGIGGGTAQCATSCTSSGATSAMQVCKLGTGECLTGTCSGSGRVAAPYFLCQ